MKKRILFVDDERNVLQGLQRSLRGQRNEWEMVFVASAREALQAVNDKRFDAIVTDMRLPVMNGAQLLETLAKDYPGLIRIILSGHSDEEMIIRYLLYWEFGLCPVCVPVNLNPNQNMG